MSTLSVGDLQGLAVNSNVVTVPTGHKLEVTDSGALIAPGHILQVVQTVKSSSFTTTSATLVDITGLSVSITPTSATSKVLVQVSAALFRTDTNFSRFSVFRGNAATGTDLGPFGLFKADTTPYGWVGVNYLDSPATTSSTTYQAALGAVIGGGTAGLQGERSTITVMEVAA